MVNLLLISLLLLAAYYAVVFASDLKGHRSDLKGPFWKSGLIGFVVNFFDVLGIGAFAPQTALLRFSQLVPDRVMPGTLNVANTLPVLIQAIIFIRIIEVEPVTLVAMLVSAAVGAVFGARVVSKLPENTVRLVMGIALLVTAGFMIVNGMQGIQGNGTAIGLSGVRLVVAVLVNALLGALMTAGIGLYAPCMALVFMLGLSPQVAFPIMMGSCAFLMPPASVTFIRKGAYDRKAALAMAIPGMLAVPIAAFLVKSLPLDTLRILVVLVVIYTAVSMLVAYTRTRKIAQVVIIIGVVSFGASARAQQPTSPLEASYAAHMAMKQATPFKLQWVSLGPTVNSARADVVFGDPTHPGTMYVGFGSGGLWKTVNDGVSWSPIFENRSSLGIGDAELAPSDPSVIYVGTGENLKKPRNFTLPGTGMFRSGDGGKTWQHIGLEDSWSIAEIAIHPKDPNIVLVAVLGHMWSPNENRGVYRTTDGGKTWQQVLHKNSSTGANDVVISPSDPNVMYASLWEVHPGISGPNSGVYRSVDGGRTWSPVNTGLPTGPKLGRIGLAVSATDPKKVYALVDNLANARDEAAELYRSTDGGLHWYRTHTKPFMIFPGIGWYFTDVYLDPKDDDDVYCLGVRLAHSKDGGKTFTYVGGKVSHAQAGAAQGLHLDQSELWIDPNDPGHLLLGNDGGIYASHDNGLSWMHYNNIPTGEFYDLTIDQSRYLIYGGTQDDATVYGPAKELNPDAPDPWKYLWIDPWDGGDGCVTQVDPVDANILFYSAQHGAAVRLDKKADTATDIMPSLPKGSKDTLRFNYITPYFISPHDHATLYHGGNFIFKSTAHGDDWKVISPDLSRSSDPSRRSVAAGALVESRIKKGLLFAGMDKGACWVTRNDGKNWEEISKGLANAYIRSICPSRFREGRVYLAMTGINQDDLHAYLYRSDDLGSHWTSIATGLPDEPVNVVLEDPMYEDIIYAGGLRGVYVSMDRGNSWSLLGKDMPQAAVADMEVHERTGDLVVATHGRGMFRLNLHPLQETKKPGWNPGTDHLMDLPEVRSPTHNTTGGGVDKRSVEKLPIDFWLTGKGEVVLAVTDGSGKEVWQQRVKGEKGFNTFRWDLVTKRRDSDLPYFTEYESYLQPGSYIMTLTVNSEVIHVLRQPFKVLTSGTDQ